MRRLGKKLLAGPYLMWMLLFTVVPLILLVYNAFTASDGSFTLANVAAILDSVNGKPFLRSIGMSLLVTGICLVLSFPLALILRKYSSNKNSFIVMIFILPMWMNFMLRTLAWRLILLNNGILNQILTSLGFGRVHLMNTMWAVILGTVYDYLPFMVLPIYNALVKIDNDVISAAQDLGAGQGTILRRIIIPLSIPGIVSGITMVMVPSISEFVIASMLGGGKVYLIGNVIEQAFNSGYADIHAGSGLSLSLMVLILISMVIYRFFDGEEGESGIW
ncbi:aBC-type spermidine/putrescine transport system permease protein 1 [Roseburia sp. CAG:380]|nr:aBC-type spermidine/putrescine transport system permease protein 1 [Roseburia sp. CAG:380]